MALARRCLVATLGLVALAGFAGPAAAQSSHGPAFFERVVLEDTPGDYDVQPHLDIVAVHAFEAFGFDFEELEALGPAFYLRVEPQALRSMESGTSFRIHVWAKLDGEPLETWVGVGRGQRGFSAAAGHPDATARVNLTSVFLGLPYDAFGLAEGSVLDDVWVATSTASAGVRIYHDVAPHDNDGMPAGLEAEPPASRGATSAEGPFSFVALEPTGPLDRLSAEGAPVEYAFRVVPAPGLSDEVVRFFFDWPEGWALEPNYGAGMPEPLGLLWNVDDARNIDFRVTVTPPAQAPVGAEGRVLMRMVSNGGAHDTVEMVTRVAPARIVSDEVVFQALSGPVAVRGETTLLAFRVTDPAGGPLPAGTGEVHVDFWFDGRLEETRVADTDGNGTYWVEFAFPREGRWVVELFLARLAPSPHHDFLVEVRSPGVLANGPGLLALSLGVGLAGWTHRRTG